MTQKKCRGCKSVYNVSDFTRNYSEKVTCNFCAARKKITHKVLYQNTKEYKKQYYLEHKEQISAQRKTEEWKKQNNAARRIHRRNNIRQFLLTWAKSRAAKNSIPFDLVLDDITIPEFCPVLGIKLEVGDSKTHDGSPSLDRVIPELGYVKGNVCVISYRANSIKRDASVEELKLVLNYVESYKK